MKKKDLTSVVEQVSREILQLLEIKDPKISLEKIDDHQLKLSVETEDSGVLIGFHGENLYAFQLMLNLIVYKQSGVWQRIIVDVAGWREKREEQLKSIALAAAQRAKFSQKPVAMPILNAAERRVIHLALADHPGIATRSEGQGRERKLIIDPTQSSPPSS